MLLRVGTLRQSIHHEGGGPTDINGANHAVPYSHRSKLEKQGLPEGPRGDTVLHVPCWTSWPVHEADLINQKKIKPINGAADWKRVL